MLNACCLAAWHPADISSSLSIECATYVARFWGHAVGAIAAVQFRCTGQDRILPLLVYFSLVDSALSASREQLLKVREKRVRDAVILVPLRWEVGVSISHGCPS